MADSILGTDPSFNSKFNDGTGLPHILGAVGDTNAQLAAIPVAKKKSGLNI
jgi:hypothetical protein